MPFLSDRELLSELEAVRLAQGVRVTPLEGDEAGAEVVWLDPEGAAAEAGVRAGDVVVRSAGLAVTNARDIAAAELLLPRQTERDLTVRRDGQEVALSLPPTTTTQGPHGPDGPDDDEAGEVARLAAQGDPRSAINLAIRLCEQDEALASDRLNRGLLHEYLDEADEALHALKQTVLLAPESGAAHRALGRVYARLGNASRARASLRKAADLTSAARDWYLLGKVLLLDMRVSEALSCADRLLAMDDPTDRAWGHVLAGEVEAVDRGDSAKAEAEFQRAAELDPSNMEALYHLARGRINAGDHESAAAMASVLLQDNAVSLRTLNLMAEVFYRREQWDQAARWMDKTVAAHPTVSPALSNRGRIALKLGRPGEALPYYRQALAHDRTYALAYVGLGDIAVMKGDVEAAAEQYRLALEYDPGESNALDRLVALCRRRGDAPLADELWARYHLVPHAG